MAMIRKRGQRWHPLIRPHITGTTVMDLLTRYAEEVSCRKRSYYRAKYFLTG